MSYKQTVIQTKEILQAFKTEQEKTYELLDFSLIGYKTLCFKDSYKSYSEEELNIFNDDDFFVEGFESVYQEYKIEVFPASNIEKHFKIRLNANADFTKLSAVLLSDEKLRYYGNIKKDIMELLFKQMIKERFLILRLDRNLEQNIEKFIQELKNGNLEKEFKFDVSTGVSPKANQMGKLIFHKNPITNSTVSKEKTGESYDDLGYHDPVKKDDLVCEFIYPIIAKSGRNLRGELLNPEKNSLSESNALKLKNESIYKQEFKDKIKYFAADYGFFTYDLDGYSVSKTLTIESVQLKTTGSIKTNIDEVINVEILGSIDSLEDAVKGGIINIQASNVKINGHVGAAKINARTLSINGGTHKESKLYANQASISIHRGFLKAQTAYIDQLENGVVSAQNVYVKSAISSKIEADYIFVEKLYSNNKLYPKKALIIEQFLKSGNLIYVTSISVLERNHNLVEYEYEDLERLFLEMESKIEDTINEMNNKYYFLVKNQIKAIEYKNLKDQNRISPTQERLLDNFQKIIYRYNYLTRKYKKLMYLYYRVYVKLKALTNFVSEVEIYIKAKEIGIQNTLTFDYSTTKKIRSRYILSEKDCEKLFYFGRQNLSINSTKNYGENNIENIKAIILDQIRPNEKIE